MRILFGPKLQNVDSKYIAMVCASQSDKTPLSISAMPLSAIEHLEPIETAYGAYDTPVKEQRQLNMRMHVASSLLVTSGQRRKC